MERLEEAFIGYTERVTSELQRRAFPSSFSEDVEFKASLLRCEFSQLEHGKEFGELVVATKTIVDPKYFTYLGRDAVAHFFRRSRVYNELIAGRVPPVADTLARYLESFTRKSRRKTHLAPLEYVHFPGKAMKFETFSLRTFTEQELRESLGQDINTIYYPKSVVNLADLSGYLWIICEEEEQRQYEPSNRATLPSEVEFQVHAWPQIDRALRPLALYQWWQSSAFEADYGFTEWMGVPVPFVITIHDDLLHPPPEIDIVSSRLLREGFQDFETGKDWEATLAYWEFNESQGAELESFIRRIEQMLLSVQKAPNWGFLNVALDALLKGFSTKGREQLLWHLVAIEALLGKKSEPINQTVSARLANMLGATETERSRVRKEFRELYDFRCQIVHGTLPSKKIMTRHLLQARVMARRCVVWFINLLSRIMESASAGGAEKLPSRSDVLLLLDMSPEARPFLTRMITTMPTGFPFVPEWIDYLPEDDD